MLDELPMIYSSLIMSYTVIEHENIKPKYINGKEQIWF